MIGILHATLSHIYISRYYIHIFMIVELFYTTTIPRVLVSEAMQDLKYKASTLIVSPLGSADDLRSPCRSAVRSPSYPKVCEAMACWALLRGFGPVFYVLLGSGTRRPLRPKP